jgi:hypothetical protein
LTASVLFALFMNDRSMRGSDHHGRCVADDYRAGLRTPALVGGSGQLSSMPLPASTDSALTVAWPRHSNAAAGE